MHQHDFFSSQREDLGQFFTPFWAAESLVERHFPDLDAGDLVLEPSCGTGAFLAAIPDHVPAIGVEIDPSVAEIARKRTRRRIIDGDFRTLPLDLRPTCILGNPPFELRIIDGFLDRARRLLPDEGRVGFILPAYTFQTPSRVVRYSESWSLFQEMLPRTLFPGLSKPLVFAIFSKDRRKVLTGFALYREAMDIASMPEPYRQALDTDGSIWREAVARALHDLGGRASLREIYAAMAPRRPTTTRWWKEKIRQIVRAYLQPVERGVYALPAPA